VRVVLLWVSIQLISLTSREFHRKVSFATSDHFLDVSIQLISLTSRELTFNTATNEVRLPWSSFHSINFPNE
jgi:hypothetical protein